MIVKCECGGTVSTDAKQCPHCGKPGPFAPPAPSTKPDYTAAWIVSLIVTGIGLWLLFR
jgi:hypothetical protein